MRTTANLILSVAGAVLAVLVIAFGAHWIVNRVYVEEGQSLRLQYKGPLVFGSREYAKPGHFAAVDEDGDPLEIGVLREMPGPGRHFYCPIWWDTKIVEDTVIRPGEVGIVTSKLGEDLPQGEFLVGGDLYETEHKGILRKVLTPGRYRVNPYAYEVNVVQTLRDDRGAQIKHAGWVHIPAGYVGVVTHKASDPLRKIESGIQQEVLPPGLYPVNPNEREIDVIGIGYVEKSIKVEEQKDAQGHVVKDESNEPLAVKGTGIEFSSTDGFNIQLDFSVIWGIMPEEAAQVVATFGNMEAVEQKVIVPQAESICRNIGSKMKAVDLLVGQTRQQFQKELDEEFQRILEEKKLTLLYGLVRHVYIPNEVRLPIQEGYLADELKLTREQESVTARVEAELREAEKLVEKEGVVIEEETKKMVANVIAEGAKTAKETEAETEQLVAAIDKQAADLEARRKEILGEATAEAQQLQEEAKAQKFQLAVEAFGSGEAYNLWQFAEGLPQNMDLQLFYAGEGTLWTDLKSVLPTLPLTTPPPAAKASATKPASGR
jgi:regulator of protease activity HflC (stomatin/prohibitin superfamily)